MPILNHMEVKEVTEGWWIKEIEKDGVCEGVNRKYSVQVKRERSLRPDPWPVGKWPYLLHVL